MAREKRQISSSGIYHILLRGIDELFSKKNDYETFIETVNNQFEVTSAKLLGMVILKNRVHIIIDEKDSKASLILKPICTSYARYYNRVHNLQGKLFYDRYKSEPIENNSDIKALKGYLNSIPSEYKFSVDGFINESGLAFLDDFCRMSDEELLSFIQAVYNVTVQKLSKTEKEELAQNIISGNRIGAGRINKIFKIKNNSAKSNKKVSAEKKIKEEKKKEEEKQNRKNDRELSVWLL